MKRRNKLRLGLVLTAYMSLTIPIVGYSIANTTEGPTPVYLETLALSDITPRTLFVDDTPFETVTKTVPVETISSEVRTIEVEIMEYNDISDNYISDSDLTLLALLTMAEAEGECEEGKRLVIDTVLNRVDSEHFPDTISEVIYQKSQFTSMHNGRFERCSLTDEVVRLVEEEVAERTNSEVMFFHANKYGAYGTPMFSVGNHYFSSYD